MTQTILILIWLSMIITSVINFAKPAYKSFAWKFEATINIGLSFILGIVASFSVAPYLELELNTGLLILLGLGLWTWSNLFYDLLRLVQNAGSSKDSSENNVEKEAAIWFDLPIEEEE